MATKRVRPEEAQPRLARRAQLPPADDPADDLPPEPPMIDDESPEDDLARALAEIGASGGGRVKAERVNPERKALEYVDDFDAATFSLKELQRMYGGGEYRLTVRDSHGRYVRSGRVVIAQPLQPREAHDPLQKVTEAIAEQSKQLQTFIAAFMLQQRATPAPAASADEVRRQIIQDLQMMRELLGAPGAGLEVSKVLEVLQLGIEMGRKAEGGGDDWVALAARALDSLGEPLRNLLAQIAAARANGAAASPAPPGAPAARPGLELPAAPAVPPAAPAPASGVQQPKGNGAMFGFDVLGGFKPKAIEFLIGKARAGADPTLYADVILDNVPDMALPLLEQLVRGDVVENLAQFDPRVKDFAEWFRALGEAVASGLAELRAPEDDTADAAKPGRIPAAGVEPGRKDS